MIFLFVLADPVLYEVRLAAAAVRNFTLAQAERERINTFMVMGQLAKRLLPVMQHLLEAFNLCVVSRSAAVNDVVYSWQMALYYIRALLWITLGCPYTLFAFCHDLLGQQMATVAMVQLGNRMEDPISELADPYGSWASKQPLSLSIPMIAYMVVAQSGAMMVGLTSRMMQSYN